MRDHFFLTMPKTLDEKRIGQFLGFCENLAQFKENAAKVPMRIKPRPLCRCPPLNSKRFFLQSKNPSAKFRQINIYDRSTCDFQLKFGISTFGLSGIHCTMKVVLKVNQVKTDCQPESQAHNALDVDRVVFVTGARKGEQGDTR